MMLAAMLAALALPTAEVELGVSSKQTKFGMVEKDGAVGTLEAEVGWYGAYFGTEYVYDHEGGREFTFGPGYGYTFFERLTASVQYLYEWHPSRGEPCTQFVVPKLQGECLLRPSVEWWIDIDNVAGASYWSFDLGHDFGLSQRFTLTADGGVGIGNALRNEHDAEFDAFGFKDIHIRLGLEYSVCEHAKIVPWAEAIQRFRHGGEDECDAFVIYGGIALSTEF